MTFMPINGAVEATRRVARSALPDAPVVEDIPREPRLRTALAILLRRRRATKPSARRPATSRMPAESC